jgi:hypothetical protein
MSVDRTASRILHAKQPERRSACENTNRNGVPLCSPIYPRAFSLVYIVKLVRPALSELTVIMLH